MEEHEGSNRRVELAAPATVSAVVSGSSTRNADLKRIRFAAVGVLTVCGAVLAAIQTRSAPSEIRGFGSFTNWVGSKDVLAAKKALMASVKRFAKAQRRENSQQLVNCVGTGFGASMCGGPTDTDHGSMRHEMNCLDAAEHEWNFVAGVKLLDNGISLGMLKDPASGMCVGTHHDPFLGQMSLQPCNETDVDQLWHREKHANGVLGSLTEGNEVTTYYNAHDGAALDHNCEGKCFRHNLCVRTDRYKAEVYDNDQLPDYLRPKFKIPEDPVAPNP